MKKIKNKIKNFIDILPFLILKYLPIIGLAIMLLFVYLVSISNLPDWFKFFLLK